MSEISSFTFEAISLVCFGSVASFILQQHSFFKEQFVISCEVPKKPQTTMLLPVCFTPGMRFWYAVLPFLFLPSQMWSFESNLDFGGPWLDFYSVFVIIHAFIYTSWYDFWWIYTEYSESDFAFSNLCILIILHLRLCESCLYRAIVPTNPSVLHWSLIRVWDLLNFCFQSTHLKLYLLEK